MVTLTALAWLSLSIQGLVFAHPAALAARGNSCPAGVDTQLSAILKQIPEAVSFCKAFYPPKPSACGANKRAAPKTTTASSTRSATSSAAVVTTTVKTSAASTTKVKTTTATTTQNSASSALSQLEAMGYSAVSTLCGCIIGPVPCTTTTTKMTTKASTTISSSPSATTTVSTTTTSAAATTSAPTTTPSVSTTTPIVSTTTPSAPTTTPSASTTTTSASTTTTTPLANPTSCSQISTDDNNGFYSYTSNGEEFHTYCSTSNGSTKYYAYGSSPEDNFKACVDACASDSSCGAVTYEESSSTCYFATSSNYDAMSNSSEDGWDSANLASLD